MKYKDLNIKLTPQRIAILEYLENNKEHPSAFDIYNVISKKFPTISLATIYNTLDVLKQKGRLLEINIDADRKRYDPNPEPHHHFICIKCKKIVDIYKKFKFNLNELELGGSEVIGNHIEFYGLCPSCKKSKK